MINEQQEALKEIFRHHADIIMWYEDHVPTVTSQDYEASRAILRGVDMGIIREAGRVIDRAIKLRDQASRLGEASFLRYLKGFVGGYDDVITLIEQRGEQSFDSVIESWWIKQVRQRVDATVEVFNAWFDTTEAKKQLALLEEKQQPDVMSEYMDEHHDK